MISFTANKDDAEVHAEEVACDDELLAHDDAVLTDDKVGDDEALEDETEVEPHAFPQPYNYTTCAGSSGGCRGHWPAGNEIMKPCRNDDESRLIVYTIVYTI